jgi:hypothetical protein
MENTYGNKQPFTEQLLQIALMKPKHWCTLQI